MDCLIIGAPQPLLLYRLLHHSVCHSCSVKFQTNLHLGRYPLGVRQRIGTSVQLSIAEQSLLVAHQQEAAVERFFGDEALDISFKNLNLKVADQDAEIGHCRTNRQHILSQVLPPLLQRLGELQETLVLHGDLAHKIARQDYYLAKQKTMMKHLVLQQGRHCFLSSMLKQESISQEKTQQLLRVLSEELSNFDSQIEARQLDYDRLNVQTLDERTTIDQRDRFSWRLHQMLGGDHPNGSFVSTSHITQHVASLCQAADQRAAAVDSAAKAFDITTYQLYACIQDAVKASDNTSGIVPSEFKPLLSELAQACAGVQAHLTQVGHQFKVQKKTLSMENSKSKFQEQMFVQLFTDPQKCIEQIQVSNSAIA